MITTHFRRRMSVILAVLGLAGATAAACGLPGAAADAAPGAPGATSASAPLRCEIQLSESHGATVIEGHVQSRLPINGHYEMEITARSGGGVSTIRQSGDFALSAGGEAMLGQTRLSGPRARFDAELTLQAQGRTLRCAEARL
jgi:hypothetical protein